MSVELNISVQENCDSLYFFDRTGKYDEVCNPTGWCPPNETIATDATAELQIYLPKTEVPIILSLPGDFPSMDNEGFEILPEDLELEKFVSGVWRFDYFVRNNGVLLTASCSKLLVEDIKCCINGKKVEVDVSNFDSKEVKEFNEVYNLFKGAISASKNGKIDKADKIIDHLYKRCKCKC